MKTCPFTNNRECNNTCPLYIDPDDMNEFVLARLSSIGIMSRNQGQCSLKVLAMSQSRAIFENTNTRG